MAMSPRKGVRSIGGWLGALPDPLLSPSTAIGATIGHTATAPAKQGRRGCSARRIM